MNSKTLRRLALGVLTTLTLIFLFTQQPFNAASEMSASKSPLSAASDKGDDESELDKEALHAQMRELQNRIATLWEEYGREPKNGDLRAQIEQLQSEFDGISASLGGDKPTVQATENAKSNKQPLTPNVVAPTPLGCPTATTNFSATPNARIPASGTSGTISRTLVVSGAGSYLWDLNLTTFITHTANADLDITLMSPAGTIVTLTTDNGGGDNHVFNGTLWDDQATTPASDSPYSNNVVVPTLVPEEAMGAFIGEDPNGTWTLTITDDALLDIGNLASWSLEVTTLGQAPVQTTQSFSNNTPAIISDLTPVTSSINVNGLGLFTGRVRLTTNITHLNPDDIEMTLTSPAGRVVTITTDNGGTTNNAFAGTIWDDDANPGVQVPYPTTGFPLFIPFNQGLATDRLYLTNGLAATLAPEGALAAFNGEDPNGTWTLAINDDSFNIQVGVLSSWALEITTETCCTITCPTDVTVSNDANQCGAVVNYAPPADNGLCDMVNCSPPSGSFFAIGTTTVTCTTTAGPGCAFSVTVNDTQAPILTCPASITAVTAACGGNTQVVNYASPSVSDNCTGVMAPGCVPPSGSAFPVGATTVNCTATDAFGNTANCSFTVTVFNACVQDDTNPNTVLLWNTFTGEYIFCCNGTTYVGQGTRQTKGSTYSLTHNLPDRRVMGSFDCATKRGNGSIQSTGGNTICTINDRNITNNSCACALPVSMTAVKK